MNKHTTQPVSLIRYNCNTWAAPRAVLDNFDVCHCKHLHTIVVRCMVRYVPTTVPLPVKMEQHVWSMFGHVLQNPKYTLAQSPEFHGTRQYRARNGRHCTNLLSVMRNDVKEVGLSTLRSRKQAPELMTQSLAGHNKQWQRTDCSCCVYSLQQQPNTDLYKTPNLTLRARYNKTHQIDK